MFEKTRRKTFRAQNRVMITWLSKLRIFMKKELIRCFYSYIT